jgi:hypothetical protein
MNLTTQWSHSNNHSFPSSLQVNDSILYNTYLNTSSDQIVVEQFNKSTGTYIRSTTFSSGQSNLTYPVVSKIDSSGSLYVLYSYLDVVESKLLLTKVGSDGTIAYEKNLNLSSSNYDLLVTSTNLFIVYNNNTNNAFETIILKTDLSGETISPSTLSNPSNTLSCAINSTYIYIFTYTSNNVLVYRYQISNGVVTTWNPAILNTPSNEFIGCISLDANQDLVLVYITDSNVSGGTNVGNNDIVLAKLSKVDGEILFLKQMPSMNTSGAENGPCLTIDSSNFIYVTYYSLDLNTYIGSVYLLKFDSSGNLLWKNLIANDDNANAFVIGYQKEIYLGYTDISNDQQLNILKSLQTNIELVMPSGLNPGDQFKFVFVTNGSRDATSGDIEVYNSFVQHEAYGAYYNNKVVQWKAVGSTESTAAKDNIGGYNSNIKVFLVDGTLIANSLDTNGFWSYNRSNSMNKNIQGVVVLDTRVWVGSGLDGSNQYPTQLGTSDNNSGFGNTNSKNNNLYEYFENNTNQYSLYGMSETFTYTYPTEIHLSGPTEAKVGSTPSFIADVSYLTTGVSSTPVLEPSLNSSVLTTNFSISALFSVGIVFIPGTNTTLQQIKLYLDKIQNTSTYFNPRISLYNASSTTPYQSYPTTLIAEDLPQINLPTSKDSFVTLIENDLPYISTTTLTAGQPYALVVKMATNQTFGINGTSVSPLTSNLSYTTQNGFTVLNTVFNQSSNFNGSRVTGIYLYSSDLYLPVNDGSVNLYIDDVLSQTGPVGATGSYIFTVNELTSVGSKSLKVEYQGTELYDPSEDTGSLNVLKQGMTIQAASDFSNSFSLMIYPLN